LPLVPIAAFLTGALLSLLLPLALLIALVVWYWKFSLQVPETTVADIPSAPAAREAGPAMGNPAPATEDPAPATEDPGPAMGNPGPNPPATGTHPSES
jgi:hypothetical protein